MAYRFYHISAAVTAEAQANYEEHNIDPCDAVSAYFDALKEPYELLILGFGGKAGLHYLFVHTDCDELLEKLSKQAKQRFLIDGELPESGVTFTAGPLDADAFIDELGGAFMRAARGKRLLLTKQASRLKLDDDSFSSSKRMSKLRFVVNYVPADSAPAEEPKKRRRPSDNEHKVSTVNAFKALTGAKELKLYLEELEAMRPILKEWQSKGQTTTQHLLFSIDSGNGCTTMLKLLYNYLSENMLFGAEPQRGGYGFHELHFLRHADNSNINMEAVLEDVKKDIAGASPGLVGIHIAEWIKLMDHPVFVRLLDFCWERRDSTVFVFIIPFVEEGVLSRVHARLSDVLNVRLIKCPPYTDDELTGFAKKVIRDYGILWDNSVDNYFWRALALERSDQRFYGMRTVVKLSTEIALMKARNVALKRNDCPKDVLMGEDFIGTIADDPYSGEISGFDQLDELIGLESVKQRVREIVASIKVQKQLFDNGNEDAAPCYHMMFTGNPGTGKTVVARIIGKIFKENGLLPRGDLIEVSRWDMVGEYIGQTGPKTVALCNSAKGSVLFIDEAYLLNSSDGVSTRDFGREALGALIAEMENNRTKFVVIMAGYEEEMETLLKLNQGLRDRMPHRLHFDSYSREELFEIFKFQLRKGYAWEDAFIEKAEAFFLGLSDDFIKAPQFGNGRFIRNIVERVRTKAMMRMVNEPELEDQKLYLLATDLESALADSDVGGLNEKAKTARIGFFAR